jgi:hypothetical protein
MAFRRMYRSPIGRHSKPGYSNPLQTCSYWNRSDALRHTFNIGVRDADTGLARSLPRCQSTVHQPVLTARLFDFPAANEPTRRQLELLPSFVLLATAAPTAAEGLPVVSGFSAC